MNLTDILTHASPSPVSHPVLNRRTPLSYVSPAAAAQMSIGTYIVVGSAAVLLWDILQHLPADLKLLAPSRIRPPTIVYLVSRILSFAHVLWSAVFYTSAVGNCADNLLGLSILYPLSISASTLLLLCRMRLVYDDNLRVVGSFSILWLCVLGETITVPFGVEASTIGPTDSCMVSELRKFTLAAAIAPIIYDTAVYIAVTCQLSATPGGKASIREKVGGMLTGSHLPGVSKAIFEDCRSYFPVTLLSNALTAIMVLMSSMSIPLRAAFFALNITLVNIMACRAYRNMKLGIFQRPNFTTSELLHPPTSAPRDGASPYTVLPVRFRHPDTDATGSRNFRAPGNYTQRPQTGRTHNALSGYKGHRACSRSRVAVNVIPASPSSKTMSFGGEEGMDYQKEGDGWSMASSHSGSGIPLYLPSEDSHRSAGKASSFLVI